MAKIDKTSKKSSRLSLAASKVLSSRTSSKVEKSVAASALTQKRSVSGHPVKSSASKILRDPRASREAKAAAASILTEWSAKRSGRVSVEKIMKIIRDVERTKR